MSAIMTRRRPLAVLAVMLAAALALALSAERAWAPRECPTCGPQARFGLAGIVEGPTLRLTAANLGVDKPDTMPACRVSLGFADLEGRAVGNADERDLRRGQGTFVDLEAAAVGNPDIREGGRVEVRPLALGGPDTRNCRLAFTAEIFGPGDNRTDVLMAGPE